MCKQMRLSTKTIQQSIFYKRLTVLRYNSLTLALRAQDRAKSGPAREQIPRRP